MRRESLSTSASKRVLSLLAMKHPTKNLQVRNLCNGQNREHKRESLHITPETQSLILS